MSEDPLGAIYAFVERAYIRLQAADIVTQCLNSGRSKPLHSMVEGFVLAGVDGLDALREILEELASREKQLEDERRKIYNKLSGELTVFGIRLEGKLSPVGLGRMTSPVFLSFLREQGLRGDSEQHSCLQLFQEATQVMGVYNKQQHILADCETYLLDWMWSLIYEAAHQQIEDDRIHLRQENRLL